MNQKRYGDYKKMSESRDRDQIIDSAALQLHMMQKYMLPGAVVRQKRPIAMNPNNSNKFKCDCCGHSNETTSTSCGSCGYIFSRFTNVETLAEKRGLVKVANVATKVLSKDEWTTIESSAIQRNESHCPICMNGFVHGTEVLLSCSHMFHTACLLSFEKFMKTNDKSCPICRTTNYQKRVTKAGSKIFQLIAAKRIQCLWRGYAARRKLHYLQRSYYKSHIGDKRRRQVFYQKELSSVTDNVMKTVKQRDNEITSIERSTDLLIEEGRQLNMLFDAMVLQRQAFAPYETKYDTKDVDLSYDWSQTISSAVRRGLGECSICMCSNHATTNKPIVVLTCSHVFHNCCIVNLEKFYLEKTNKGKTLSCPVCRCVDYEKKILDLETIQSFQFAYNLS